MKFLFGWVFLILSLSYRANVHIVTQVPFHPIRIATVGTSWTRIVRRPALGISSATFKNYANKAIQVGVESRMREYGYNAALEVALNVAGQIRFIQEACQGVAANSSLLVAQSTLHSEFHPVRVDDQFECTVRNFVFSNHFVSHFSERKTPFPRTLIPDMTSRKNHEQRN